MCGIFGASGTPSKELILALGFLNRERGTQSAGIGFHNKSGVSFKKVASDPMLAFSSTLIDAIDTGVSNGLLLGHTRQATQGKITSDNAHPWMDSTKSFVFAHNGIITNDEEFGKFEVDSMALEEGIRTQDFSKYKGMMGVCWLDKAGFLYLYQNSQELHYAKAKGTIYFSSDKDHLKQLGLEPKEVAEDKIYKIRGGKIIETKKVPSPEPYSYLYNTGDYSEVTWYNKSRNYTPELYKSDPLGGCGEYYANNAGTTSRTKVEPELVKEYFGTSYQCQNDKHEFCMQEFDSFHADYKWYCECKCHGLGGDIS